MTHIESQLLEAGARILSTQPFITVSLGDVAAEASLSHTQVKRTFPLIRDVGTAILNYEGDSMREAQREAAKLSSSELGRLEAAFRLVGRNLASNVLVRAGVRIATESSTFFPERNINPFRTWEKFVVGHLEKAVQGGELLDNVSVPDAAWLFVSAGMGTKDLLSFTDDWASAEEQLGRTARLVIDSLRRF